MTQLVPCPDCRRHVSIDESACPFCSATLDLSQVPPPSMPRTRLGRAATFAFGATVIGAALATACGGATDDDDDEDGSAAAAGKNSGGKSGGTGGVSAGMSSGANAGTGAAAGLAGSGAIPIYGAPPSEGGGNSGGANPGSAGTGGINPGGTGGANPGDAGSGGNNAGGASPAGNNAGGSSGEGIFPVYGAAPNPGQRS